MSWFAHLSYLESLGLAAAVVITFMIVLPAIFGGRD
jgi:hypothetical protein